ncbi:MAG: 5'-3' exonuclease H3TH domain-containing protein [Microgenomates group bacterium]
MSKLLLVDGSALLHRAYHAYPPLKSKSGEIVGAVYGVASILISALEEVKPTHVMVAWDLPKPTFRHIKYVGYKAQRPKADSEMVEQIPKVKAIIGAMEIVQIEQEGYEADDIIGTLSKIKPLHQLTNEPFDIVILTGDQDTMQLVNENVRILTPAKGANPPVLYGVDEVKAKYGVRPDQIVDYKALIGDPSDNIPGVAGIGPKSAASLLNQFGTVKNIYKNIDKIENEKVKEKLLSGKDSVELSYELSKIVCDMQISTPLEAMEYLGLQGETLKARFEEYGFKSLIKRFFPEPEIVKIDPQMGLF